MGVYVELPLFKATRLAPHSAHCSAHGDQLADYCLHNYNLLRWRGAFLDGACEAAAAKVWSRRALLPLFCRL